MIGVTSIPAWLRRPPARNWWRARWIRRTLAAAVVAGLGVGLFAYDIARNASGILMRRGAILTHDCATGAGPCASGQRCFRLYTIDYDCESGALDPAGWQAGPITCLPESTTITALQSKDSGRDDYPCRLFRYVASGTCCPADCSGAVTTAPSLPTGAEADACCCCPCPDDCLGCGATKTVTIAGTLGPYGTGPGCFDGTFPVKAVQVRAAGDPDVSTLADCVWNLVNPDGSITDDLTLSCKAIDFLDGGHWVVEAFAGCQFIKTKCCPSSDCPISGVYVSTNILFGGSSCDWIVTVS